MFRCRALLLVIIACVGGYAQIINPGGGGGSGTVSANNGTAGCVANYAAAGGSTTVGPDTNLCDNGSVWNVALGFTFTGTTTAANTITGGGTNIDISLTPNGTGGVVFPAGAATCAAIKFAGDTACAGIYRSGALGYSFTNGGTPFATIAGGAGFRAASGGAFGWSSSTSSNGAFDTCSHRSAAGVVGFDTDSACSNSQGKLKAAGYISTGTTFTGNAGCSETTLVGGATAGKFTAVSTSCTVVITLGNTATAPNGWACYAHDLTTSADYNNPHASSSGTAVTIVTGTIVSSDVIEFGCVGY